jgi:methylmalonyl-CoA mutase cobalamin-binding subunit
VSTVGVILSAIFWTWLWGPVGLILSMPMTVCLLVAARHVPQLKFLTVLLADQPTQTPAERVYQRLLAFDYREPLKLARAQLDDAPLVTYYDEVLLPALVMAENDRHADLLNDEQEEFVMGAAEDIINDLAKTAQREAKETKEQAASAAGAATRVLCMPLRDEGDEMAARMLTQLLAAEGFAAVAGAAESLTGELVEQVATSDCDFVVISVLPPISPRDSRLLWRRLRNRYPQLPIVVGFWTADSDKEALAEPVEDAASRVVTSLGEAVAVIRSLAAQQRPVAKTG